MNNDNIVKTVITTAAQDPRIFFNIACLIAVYFLYSDIRDVLHSQARAFKEITSELHNIQMDISIMKHEQMQIDQQKNTDKE